MNADDKRIVIFFIGIYLVTNFLPIGSVRSYWERYLVLSLVPGLSTAIGIFELLGDGNIGTIIWYVKLLWICSSGYLTLLVVSYIKNLFKKYQ